MADSCSDSGKDPECSLSRFEVDLLIDDIINNHIAAKGRVKKKRSRSFELKTRTSC